MEQTPSSSRRLLLVGLGAVVLLIIAVAVVAFALFGTTKHENNATTTTGSKGSTVATKDQVKQNLSDVNDSIKQAAADQAAAKAALQDSSNQVKVGS